MGHGVCQTCALPGPQQNIRMRKELENGGRVKTGARGRKIQCHGTGLTKNGQREMGLDTESRQGDCGRGETP